MDEWDAGDQDDVLHDRTVASKHHAKLAETFGKAGFRDGVEAGKHEFVQAGFNDGFKGASETGFMRGQARGSLMAALVLSNTTQSLDAEGVVEKEILLTRVTSLLPRDLDEPAAKSAVIAVEASRAERIQNRQPGLHPAQSARVNLGEVDPQLSVRLEAFVHNALASLEHS